VTAPMPLSPAPLRGPLPGPLVDAAWLAEHAGEVRIVDSRWYLDGRSGREAYEGGHVPGAVWVDVDRDLSAPASPAEGRHPLPSPEHLAAALGRLGIGPATPVVVYDDARGSVAARLWWMLHVLGRPVAVLDGGLAAWTGPLERGTTVVAPVACPPKPWPADRIAEAGDIERLRTDDHALVLDARSTERYERGDLAIDPRRGHIPGARSAPWMGNVDADGRFLPAAELRARFDALGAATAGVIACYCGSGVTACHDLLALELAGHGDRTRLYPGSWSQWGAAITRPAATGPDSPTDPGR
jgi:thiosulfate/3-mercaptopyruvate sulfurtransferase